ncbi:MAG: AI-2E family transporter [Myxococcaceae bacterium]
MTLKTAFTVCFAVTATAALVIFILRTRTALTLCACSAMVAIALNHLVHVLQRRGIRRGWAIAIVVGGAIVLLAGVLLLVIPAAVSQGRALVQQVPRLVDEIRQSRGYQVLDQHLGLEQVLRNTVSNVSGLTQTGASPVLGAIGGVVTAVAGAATLAALVVLMLVFGPGLLTSFFKQVDVDARRQWERITARSYTSIGGYLGGLLVICSVNATLTTTCLAVLQIPFFLPLGILSGFSSLVPYAGPLTVAALVTVLTLLTSGVVKASILVGYFMFYGQFEGNVLGPFVFRRTVHLDPLVTLLAILFLAEFMGIVGAIIAVPAVAIAQIVVRELLVERREQSSARSERGQSD